MPKIPFARVACNGGEIRNVTEVISSGWLTTVRSVGCQTW